MSRHRPRVSTLCRPMRGWWRRDPWFVRYLLREATALGIVAYALVLLAGLAGLVQGPAGFARWQAWLASPVSFALHAVMLACAIGHAWTWFGVLPRTLPRLPLSDTFVSALGRIATVLLSLAVLAVLAGGAR